MGRALVAGLLIAAAMVGSVVSGPAAVSSGFESASQAGGVADERTVEPLESAPSRVVEVERPGGRFVGAEVSEPRDRVRELEEERTATSEVWEYSDGVRSVTVSSSPRFFQARGSELWRRIDTSVVPDDSRAGWFRSAANRWRVSFGPSAVGQALPEINLDGASVGFVPLNAAVGVRPVVEGATATYRGLWRDTDVVYRVTEVGVDERIVLGSSGAPERFAFALRGATPALRSDGGVDLFVGGELVGMVPAPTAETIDGLVDPAEAGVMFSLEEVSAVDKVDGAEVGDGRSGSETVPSADVGTPSDPGSSSAPEAGQDAGSGPVPGSSIPEGDEVEAPPLSDVTVGSERASEALRLVVSVDRNWLDKLPAEVFPVVIDPTFIPASPSTPTTVRSYRSNGTVLHGTAKSGVDGSSVVWRSMAEVPIPDPPSSGTQPWYLVDARLKVNRLPGSSACVCSLAAFGELYPNNYGNIGAWNSFDLMPIEDGTADFAFDATPWIAAQGGDSVQFGFRGDENVSNQVLHLMATPSLTGISVEYFFFQSSDPTELVSPVGTISSTTPTLTAAVVEPPDPDSAFDDVYYNFKIATAADGSGQVVDSGWVDDPSWTVPAGVLADGVTYYVRVWNNIGFPWAPGAYGYFPAAEPTTVKSFVIKARLGDGGPSPTDTVGSVPGSTSTPSVAAPSPGISPASMTVNMVTGNVSAVVGTKSLPALGGSAGVTLNYDSIGPDSLHGGASGLYGKYWVNGQPVGSRLDPSIDFVWTGSPMGGLATQFEEIEAEWNGLIQLPPSGTWRLGARPGIGSMTIIVDGVVYASIAANTEVVFGAGSLAAGGQHTIKVTYSKPAGVAGGAGQLWAFDTELATDDPGQKTVVPTGWLSPRATGLPTGWQLSVNPHAGSWTRLEDLGDQVVIRSATGQTATFERLADGTYRPPIGSDAMLSTRRTTVESGIVAGSVDGYELSTAANVMFRFGSDGWVQQVNSIADDREPTALQYGYQALPGLAGTPVLTSIADPVTQRLIGFCYGPTCTGGQPGWYVPDAMLARIDHWDGTSTELRYDQTSGQLSRVVASGGLVADFGYDSERRLVALRDPLANAALAAGARPDCVATEELCATSIEYDTDGRAVSVRQPAPIQGATRPQRDYDWSDVGARQATVRIIDASGIPATVVEMTTVWDEQGRVIEHHDPAGRVTATKWDPNIDRPVASVDAAGLQTTSVYDNFAQTLTDEYGPAPTSCFDSTYPYEPNGSCPDVTHTSHTYDDDIDGLRATFWPNPYLAGAPSRHTTGFAGSQGGPTDPLQCPTGDRVLSCVVWPTLPVTPAGGSIPVTGNEFTWSARFEGAISSPTDFVLSLETSQHLTVYIDGEFYDEVDASTSNSAYTNPYGAWPAPWVDPSLASIPAGDHEIRIDYRGSSTTANGFWIDWSPNQLAQRTCVIDMSNAVAWWSGDSDLTAEIGADAIDTYQPGYGANPVTYTTGLAGNAMQFNITSVAAKDFPVISNALTVETWVKPGPGPYDGGPVMGRYKWAGDSPDNAYVLMAQYFYDGATWWLDDAGARFYQSFSAPSAQLSDGNWHHLAATWDGQYARIYIDGQLAVTGLYSFASPNLKPATGIDFRLGAGLGGYYTGLIDEPAVFRDALDASEIAAIYNAGSNGKCAAPPPNNVTFHPMYGLRTSTTDPDGLVTSTSYNDPTNDIGPEHGLPVAVTQDPGGLALTTTSTYENPDTGQWLRKTASTLPTGSSTTWDHYCGSNQAGCASHEITGAVATACGVTAGDDQWGLLAQRTDPAPDTATPARTQQFLYDNAGRTVGTRTASVASISTAPWQCTSYDNLGRVTHKTWPSSAGSSLRSDTTYIYNVGGNPLRATVTDSNGSVTATVDLLGRVVSYSDTTGFTTTTTYDPAGRTTQVVTGTTAHPASHTNTYHNISGDLTQVTYGGPTPLTVELAYDAAGRTESIDYAGPSINTKTLTASYNSRGLQDSIEFTQATGPGPARILGDQADYTAAGRRSHALYDTGGTQLVDPNTTGDGADYEYDPAGRLTRAHLPDGVIDIGYNTAPGSDNCAQPDAGRNTNRTTYTFTPTIGAPVEQRWCYNNADQLQNHTASSTDTFTYDERGNQLTDGTSTNYTWDSSDRLQSFTSGTDTITYTRDALDRLIERTDNGIDYRYTYHGHTDTPGALSRLVEGALIAEEHYITLPGGVTITYDATTGQRTWSYPNLQGHTVTTTDDTGNRNGTITTYDPWGVQLTTGPDNTTTSANQAAFGTHGKLQETSGLIHMGARPYAPQHAHFLSVDPIHGGCANNYTYGYGDPISGTDLSGQNWLSDALGWVGQQISEHRCGLAQIATFGAVGGCIILSAGACAVGAGLAFGARSINMYIDNGSDAWAAIAADGLLTAASLGIVTASLKSASGVGILRPLFQVPRGRGEWFVAAGAGAIVDVAAVTGGVVASKANKSC